RSQKSQVNLYQRRRFQIKRFSTRRLFVRWLKSILAVSRQTFRHSPALAHITPARTTAALCPVSGRRATGFKASSRPCPVFRLGSTPGQAAAAEAHGRYKTSSRGFLEADTQIASSSSAATTIQEIRTL